MRHSNTAMRVALKAFFALTLRSTTHTPPVCFSTPASFEGLNSAESGSCNDCSIKFRQAPIADDSVNTGLVDATLTGLGFKLSIMLDATKTIAASTMTVRHPLGL